MELYAVQLLQYFWSGSLALPVVGMKEREAELLKNNGKGRYFH
jgi:hypothetical protein